MASEAQTGAGATSKKTMVMLIVGIVLVAILLSAGVTWFLMSGNDSPAPVETTAPAGPQLPQRALYVELPPAFIVTYSYLERQRYMQVFVTALTRQPKAAELIELHLPLLRHQLNLLFGDQPFDGLQTDEGREALREKAKALINQMLEKEAPGTAIEQVLFTNFVMQ